MNEVMMCEVNDETDCWYLVVIVSEPWQVEFI